MCVFSCKESFSAAITFEADNIAQQSLHVKHTEPVWSYKKKEML